MQEYELGIYDNITNDEYHADREYLSSSVIKCAYDNLKKYKDKYVDGNTGFSSDALRIGNAFHTMVLEPHLFDKEYNIFDNKEHKLTTKKGKEEYSKFQLDCNKNGISFVKQTELKDLKEMSVSAIHSPLAKELWDKKGVAEQSMFSIEPNTGVPVKVRLDWFCKEHNIIIDLKSSRDARRSSFSRDVYYNFHYDLSAALYVDVVKELTGKKCDYYWVVVDKAAPFTCGVYKMSDETYEKGREKYLIGLRKIQKANKSKNYSYQSKIGEI